jgi:hypothetical protein
MGEALSMGWCLAIIQKSLLWTIVGNMFRENHHLSTLNTSFVDLEIEWADCNRCKKNVPLQHFFRSVKRRPLSWPTPSLSQTSATRWPTPSLSQTSSTRLTHTFHQLKRCRLGWPTPALSQTLSTRLTHTCPQSNVVDSVDPHLPSVKRRRLDWPTPSLSQASSTRLTHTFPHFYVILYWTCSRPEYR